MKPDHTSDTSDTSDTSIEGEQKRIHVQILTPINYSFKILKFMLYRILLIEINNSLAEIILSAIYETSIFKLKLMTAKFFPNNLRNDAFDKYLDDQVIQFKELTEDEKWILLLGEQIIVFEKHFKVEHSKIKLELFKEFHVLFSRFLNFHQKNIHAKIKLIDEKENDAFTIKQSWVLLKNQTLANQKILYIEPNQEFTLKKLGNELDKLLYGVLNHDILALMISKMLKMTHIDSYSSVISSKFSLMDNNRVTPALEDINYMLYSKTCSNQIFSAIDFVTDLLFRSCGVKKLSLNVLSNIFISLLYSELPFDENVREYMIILLHKDIHRNYIYGSQIFDTTSKITSKILIFNKPSIIKEITGGFYDIFEIKKMKLTKESIPSPLIIRNLMIKNLVYYLLINPIYSGIFKIKYVKTLTTKISSFVKCLPIDISKEKAIVEAIMNSYFKSNQNGQIDIKMFMILLNQNLNKSYYNDDTIYNKYKFVLSENDGFNIYDCFKPLLFGNFWNNCELCDNVFVICQNNCHIMDCGNHKICIDCADKIFNTKCYTQGQRINLINFVCPICQKPEANHIYKVPEGFYENPTHHCLCSYPDCQNIAKMSTLPPCQAAGLEPEPQEPQEPQENHENYCQQHLRLMHLMSYVPVEMINSVKECPSCHNLINRIDGCSHITCQCGKQFCWICDYVHENNASVYNHPSYCRGTHTWERSLRMLVDISTRMLSEITRFYDESPVGDNDQAENNLRIHQLIGNWVSNDFASPEINAQSFWSFQLWLNETLRNQVTIDTLLPEIIAEICEWIQMPSNSNTPIGVLASNLSDELHRLKSFNENLFEKLND
jgi:hypothetical protein